jgi:hypothetical protein
MRIIIEGIESLAQFDMEAVQEQVAETLAAHVARMSDRDIAKLLDDGIKKAVGRALSRALTGRVGDIPVTLMEAIRAEAHAQITQGQNYKGTSTPLNQMVAAEVYRVMHDDVMGLLAQAQKSIREQFPQEIARMLSRDFSR